MGETVMKGDRRHRELAGMHALATSLLVAMLAVFLATTLLVSTYPWLSYARAFAEAAMVGALADWFAVTALFRRPLGLPIPHTAVIPANKDRIGESLGQFVEEHFLPADVIRARLEQVDFGEFIARWLADPDNAARLADQATRLLPRLLASLDDRHMGVLIRDKINGHLDALDLSSLAGEILEPLAADHLHQRLFDEMLQQCIILIAENETFIRERIRARTGWLWKKLAVDERAFKGIMDALVGMLSEAEENTSHALRLRFDLAVRDFIRNLKESPDYRRRAAAVKQELLRNPALQEHLADIWYEIRARLLADAAAPDSNLARHLQDAVASLGKTLLADEALRSGLNPWLREAVVDLVESHRQDLARLIPDTVSTWDGETMARRLELQVGKDLQFIRINGTLVGGLVGLSIHVVSRLFGL